MHGHRAIGWSGRTGGFVRCSILSSGFAPTPIHRGGAENSSRPVPGSHDSPPVERPHWCSGPVILWSAARVSHSISWIQILDSPSDPFVPEAFPNRGRGVDSLHPCWSAWTQPQRAQSRECVLVCIIDCGQSGSPQETEKGWMVRSDHERLPCTDEAPGKARSGHESPTREKTSRKAHWRASRGKQGLA